MKLHSKTDVIMNSSATVYSWVVRNAKEKTFEALQKLMDMMGLKGQAKDVFDVWITYNKGYLYDNYVRCSDEWGQYTEALGLDKNTRDKKVQDDFIFFINELICDGTIEIDNDDREGGDGKTIIIKSKINNEEMDFGGLLWKLHSIEAGYD